MATTVNLIETPKKLEEKIDSIADSARHVQHTELKANEQAEQIQRIKACLLYTSPSPRDRG